MKPWLNPVRRLPPKADADFVCAMEDVLKTYARDFGGDSALVCRGRDIEAADQGDPDAPAGPSREERRPMISSMSATAPPACSWSAPP